MSSDDGPEKENMTFCKCHLGVEKLISVGIYVELGVFACSFVSFTVLSLNLNVTWEFNLIF